MSDRSNDFGFYDEWFHRDIFCLFSEHTLESYEEFTSQPQVSFSHKKCQDLILRWVTHAEFAQYNLPNG